MGALNSILKRLAPLKIYKLTKTSNVYKEVLTYSKELDLLTKELDDLLQECFVHTAGSYGLSRREIVYTTPKESLSAEKRRSMLIGRKKLSDSDFTYHAFEEALKSFGTETFTITERPAWYLIAVEIYGSYTDQEKEYIRTEAGKMIPAHQTFELCFNGPDWNFIEKKNYTFQNIDGKAYTWEQIDELKT